MDAPPHDRRRRPPRSTSVVTLGVPMLCGAAVLIWTAWIWSQRIGYPGPLEVMEEGMGVHAWRVAQGLPLYTEPSADHMSFVYGPLYHVLGGLAFAVLGPDLRWLRLLSLAATLVSLAFIAGSVWRSGGPGRGRLAAAIAAMGLFTATYGHTAAWFDLARVDMVQLALLLGGLVATRRAADAERPAVAVGIAAALAVAAFLTKQSALGVSVAAALGLAVVRPRRGLWLLAGQLCGSAAVLGLLHATTGGWSTFSMVDLPAQHAWIPELAGDIVHRLLVDRGGLVVLAVAGGVALWRREGRAALPVLGFVAGALATGALQRLRDGGWYNVMIPANAGLAVLAGLGLLAGARAFIGTGARALLGRLAVLGLVVVQLVGSAAHAAGVVPTAAQRAHARRIDRLLGELPGPVFAPTRGLTLVRHGMPAVADGTALWDLGRSSAGELRDAVAAALLADLRAGRWPVLLVNDAARDLAAASHPLVVPAFPDGEHAATAAPLGPGVAAPADAAFERLWWCLRADREALARRLLAALDAESR